MKESCLAIFAMIQGPVTTAVAQTVHTIKRFLANTISTARRIDGELHYRPNKKGVPSLRRRMNGNTARVTAICPMTFVFICFSKASILVYTGSTGQIWMPISP